MIACFASGKDAFVLHIEPDENIRIFTGQNCPNTGQGFGFAGVDGDDLSAGIGGKQNLGMEHTGHFEVIGVNCLSGNFVSGIFSVIGLTDTLVFGLILGLFH